MLESNELKKMDTKSLNMKLGTLKSELFTMQINKSTSGIEKTHLYKNLKKDIARVLTAINAIKGR